MKVKLAVLIALLLPSVAIDALAQGRLDLLRLAPDELTWVGEAGEVVRAQITGDSTATGLYAYRARFPTGFRVMPHYHPDQRIVTVISGTLMMGFGETFDEAGMRPLPAGSLWTEPANQAHFVWARDGEVVIQIIGYGPSGTVQIPGQ